MTKTRVSNKATGQKCNDKISLRKPIVVKKRGTTVSLQPATNNIGNKKGKKPIAIKVKKKKIFCIVNTYEKKVFDYTTKTKRDSVLKQMNELTSLTNIKAIDFFDKSDKEIYVKGTLTIKQEDGVVDIKSTTQDKKIIALHQYHKRRRKIKIQKQKLH